jgi:exodeoxyribonuclease V alpha subunit
MYISKIIDEYGKQNNISEAMRMISDDNESEYYKTLNKKQRMAIEIARSERMMVLTGPAGTGKTYVIKSILREYQKNKVSFALCAPTGKAARRIESVVFEKAQTIHKLLDCRGLSDDGNVDFEYNERNKLDFGVIIVDEISMADSRLVCHLFKAIDFEKTNIIFVGDHNQLPPVGPGNYLRDMLETNKIKSVVLDEVVRQAGDLQKNSTNVLSGEVSRQKTKDWMVCDSMDNEEDVQNMVLKVYNHYLEAGFEANEIQVVSPMYKGMAGVANLNTTLRAAYLMRKGILVEDDFFKVMDKVICTKNDYNLGIMNGMTGKVISADKVSKIIEVRFDDNKDIIKIEGEDIKMISYAYALTVHKVQGDQIPIVISVIQKSHDHMFKSLGRNLLYTAVTRAQKTSIIVGDRFTIDDTARINNIHKRRTLLSLL